jgi:hypothetical protein
VALKDLFGRRRRPASAAREKLFALSTAQVTLDMDLGLKPAGVAAIVFKPMSAGEFTRVESDMQQLLDSTAAETGTKVEQRTDSFGYTWLIIRDPDLEDLVTTTHLVASELEDAGFGPQLLCAVFRFEGGGKTVYWIYGFKNRAFWPFVPKEGQERDNAEELELKAKLERELPIEPDLTKWLALFDAPV